MKGSSLFANDWEQVFHMMEQVVEMRRRQPALWHLVHPRRLAHPQGYTRTTINSAMMSVHLEFMDSPHPNKVEIDTILSTWQICKSLVPTIFVGKEFSESLVNTEPPDNLIIRDLQWPHEGMVFVLHDDFMWKYFQRAVPFIRVATHPTGRHRAPEMVRKLYPNAPEFGISETSFDKSCFIVTATVMFGDKPVDYSASFPDNEPIGAMMNDPQYQNFCVDDKSLKDLGMEEAVAIEDRKLLKKIIALAAHLLLAMNAVPEQIEAPHIQWPERERVRARTPEIDWVWHPQFLGRTYQWQRERADHGGTHASPRLHPRRGHWRYQPHGPGRKEKKVIWIRPMLIGAKPERT